MATRKQLAIALSKLKVFENPKVRHEQYPTDSNVAADVLWHAYMLGDIEDKTMSDLGCGTGILGIGALLLGASHVHFVDSDSDALDILKQNLAAHDISDEYYTITHADVATCSQRSDVVLQNPPFGTKQEHADKVFLEVALRCAPRVYSFHKLSTEKFIRAITKDFFFTITEVLAFNFPLKKTQKFHKHDMHTVEVGCYCMTLDDTITTHKDQLRERMLSERKKLTQKSVTQKSERISKALRETEQYKNAQTVCCYVSFKNEVATHTLIDTMIADGKTVIVPRITDEGIEICSIQSRDELVPGTFDIPEPTGACYEGELDLILVPLLAFDDYNNRLGFGKGHYDRFLTKYANVPTIGLAYAFQKVPKIPTEAHDIPLGAVICD